MYLLPPTFPQFIFSVTNEENSILLRCSVKALYQRGIGKIAAFRATPGKGERSKWKGVTEGWPLGMRQEPTGKLPRTRYVHLRIFLIPLSILSILFLLLACSFCVFLTLSSLFPPPLAERSGDCKPSPFGALALFSSSGEYFAVSFIRIGCRLSVNLRDLTAHRSSNRVNCDRTRGREIFFTLETRNSVKSRTLLVLVVP